MKGEEVGNGKSQTAFLPGRDGDKGGGCYLPELLEVELELLSRMFVLSPSLERTRPLTHMIHINSFF